MSRPSGLGLLVRPTPLTDQEWLNLLEARRELLQRHLPSFHLAKLGYLQCMHDGIQGSHELQADDPEVTGDTRFSLNTLGLFYEQPPDTVKRVPYSGYFGRGIEVPDGTRIVWGITGANQLLLVTIQFVGQAGGLNLGRQCATTVTIVETDFKTILAATGESPRRILEKLGEAVEDYVQRCRDRLKAALRVEDIIKGEEAALALIPTQETPKTKPSP